MSIALLAVAVFVLVVVQMNRVRSSSDTIEYPAGSKSERVGSMCG